MLRRHSAKNAWAINTLFLSIMAPAASAGCPLSAGQYVEFDFARSAECHDVTPSERTEQYQNERLIEVRLPLSVRIRGVRTDDVEELDMEINGAAAGLRVHGFSPSTTLASDLSKEIETTNTSKNERSLGATLGGALPMPHTSAAAQVSPSINANTSSCETTTEKSNRLPPKYAVVVSGTTSDGRGVFFKLKRSSQSSLEGVHELAVVFVAPIQWQRGDVTVVCSARGLRKVLWIKQPTTFSRETGTVQLYVADATIMPHIVRRLPETVPAGNAR
jgi:hypothetical protein